MDPEIIHDEFPALNGKKSNYYQHRKTALKWIQMLSGKEWTDYNAHDPGVTILEALCYALTEVEYKLDFAIEDILYGLPSDVAINLEENAFFLAEKILTTAPVTEADYRKLIIDRVASVNNAWLVKKEEAYEVLLLKEKDVDATIAIKETQKLLRQYRSYGTKFKAIKIAEFDYIPLNVDIFVNNQMDVEEILAQLFFNLNEAILNPNPHRQPFGELVEEGANYHDIFDGPEMQHGIIKKESLTPITKSLSAIKIKKIIAATAGIDMIDHFVFTKRTVSEATKESTRKKESTTEKIEIAEDSVPFFTPILKEDNKRAKQDQSANTKKDFNTIRVFKNQEPIEGINYDLVHDLLVRMAHRTRRDYVLNNKNQSSSYVLRARNRNIQEYYSIKNDFPLVYGLQNKGYSVIQNFKSHDGDQLEAYLLPFEQILANTFMRLAHLRDVFSIRKLKKEAKHYGLAVPAFKSTAIHSNVISETSTQDVDYVDAYIEPEQTQLEHRETILTHLLARFDMHLYEDFEIDLGDDVLQHIKRDIKSKQKVLKRVDRITANRSIHDASKSKKRTSLEEEIYARLGILKPPKRPLYKAIKHINYNLKHKKTSGNFKIVRKKRRKSKKREIYFHITKKQEIKYILRNAAKASSYKLIPKKKNNKYRIILVDENKQDHRICTVKSRTKAVRILDKLMLHLRLVNSASEGFYMIDHALLADSIEDIAFARYRMSFVFPAWGTNFQNRSFQKKTRDLVHYLVPAHIRADCLWLDLNEMKIFEKTHEKWKKASKNNKHEKAQKHQNNLKELLCDYVKTKRVL